MEKYAAEGGWLGLEVRQTAETLTVRVRDRGPGIPASAGERVFRPFQRLKDGVNEGASGTGLGLSIARELAALMGGSLRLVPTETGACFELTVAAPAEERVRAEVPA